MASVCIDQGACTDLKYRLRSADRDQVTVALISTDLIVSLLDPWGWCPWDTVRDAPTQGQVQMLVEMNIGESRPASEWTTAELADGNMHARRIAYLVRRWHSSMDDAIQVDVLGAGSIRLMDGWHRLHAASLRADRKIHVDISGYLNDAERMLEITIP